MAPSLAVDVLTVSELRGLFATHFYSMLDVRCWMFDVLEFKQEHRTFNAEHRSRLNHTQKTRRDESYFSPRRVLHRRSTVWRANLFAFALGLLSLCLLRGIHRRFAFRIGIRPDLYFGL